VLGCGSRPKTPEEAFARLRAAAAPGADRSALFDLVDESTRASLISVYRYEREMVELIEQSYPPALRQRELARLAAAAHASDQRDYFARFVDEGDKLATARQAPPTSPVSRLTEDTAQVEVPGGGVLPFQRDPHGRWGYSGLARLLEDAKQRDSQAVRTTRENARLYGDPGALAAPGDGP
jgi:hypothetical protein